MKINKSKLWEVGAIATVSVVVLLFFLVITSGDFSIPLQNGYRLARLNAGSIALDRQIPGESIGEGIIDPNVDSYAVSRHIIIGHRSAPFSPEDFDRNYGYFVVNTNSHKVSQGLTKKAWLEELRRIGISKPLKMQEPTRPKGAGLEALWKLGKGLTGSR